MSEPWEDFSSNGVAVAEAGAPWDDFQQGEAAPAAEDPRQTARKRLVEELRALEPTFVDRAVAAAPELGERAIQTYRGAVEGTANLPVLAGKVVAPSIFPPNMELPIEWGKVPFTLREDQEIEPPPGSVAQTAANLRATGQGIVGGGPAGFFQQLGEKIAGKRAPVRPPIPAAEEEAGLLETAASLTGAAYSAYDLVRFMATPEGLATMVAGPVSKLGQALLGAGFATDMAAQVVEAARQAGEMEANARTPEEKAQARRAKFGLLANIIFPGLISGGALKAGRSRQIVPPPEIPGAKGPLPPPADAVPPPQAKAPDATTIQTAAGKPEGAPVIEAPAPAVPAAPVEPGIRPPGDSAVAGAPQPARANALAVAETKAPASSKAEDFLSREARRHAGFAEPTEGGQGIAAGAGNIEGRWREGAMLDLRDALRAGKTLDEAAAIAKEKSKEAIRKHNARRPKDVNWKRWDESTYSTIDDAVRDLKALERGEIDVTGAKVQPAEPAAAGDEVIASAQRTQLAPEAAPIKLTYEEFLDAERSGPLLDALRKVPKPEETPAQKAAAEKVAAAEAAIEKAKLQWTYDRQSKLVRDNMRSLSKAKQKLLANYDKAFAEQNALRPTQREVYDRAVAAGVLVDPAKAPVAAAVKTGKQPWEVTKEEFKAALGGDLSSREQELLEAMSNWKKPAGEFAKIYPGAADIGANSREWSSLFKRGLMDKAWPGLPSMKGKIELSKSKGENPWGPQHRDFIEQALREGKSVPAEVLADYPDLKPAATEAPPTVADAKPAAVEPAPAAVTLSPKLASMLERYRVLSSSESPNRGRAATMLKGKVQAQINREHPGDRAAQEKAWEDWQRQAEGAAPAAPAAPAPFVADVAPVREIKAGVKKVAKTQGELAAAAAKKTLVSELDKLIATAPEKAKLPPDQLAAWEKLEQLRKGREGRALGANTGAETAEGEVARRELEADAAMTGLPVHNISIPGDGDFTVWGVKETLQDVRDAAARLKPGREEPKMPKPPTGEPPEGWTEKGAKDAIRVYGSPGNAYRRLSNQLQNAKDLELEGPQLKRLAGLVDYLRDDILTPLRKAEQAARDARIRLTNQKLGRPTARNLKSIEAGVTQQRAIAEKELGHPVDQPAPSRPLGDYGEAKPASEPAKLDSEPARVEPAAKEEAPAPAPEPAAPKAEPVPEAPVEPAPDKAPAPAEPPPPGSVAPVPAEAREGGGTFVARKPRDFTIFNNINSPQFTFFFGKLGKVAKAAWELIARTEFKMRSAIGYDLERYVKGTVENLPRRLRRKGAQAFHEILDGRDIATIERDWQNRPGGDKVIESARQVKGRLEEIRVTIRDTKRDAYAAFLMAMKRADLEALYNRNVPNPAANTTFMTKKGFADALAVVEFPDNWGIADGSYLPHLFAGNIRVTVRLPGTNPATFSFRAKTVAEARAKIYELGQQDPAYHNATWQVSSESVVPADMVRLGNARFWKLVADMKAQVASSVDVRAALQGIVGRKAAQTKWWGALKRRQGFRNYSRDYEQTMTAYLQGFHRWKELSAMQKRVQPLIEKVRREGRTQAALALEDIVEYVWGKPSRTALQFDNFVQRIPGVRDYAKPLLLDRVSRQVRSLTALGTLSTLRFAAVNRLQPLLGLYPLLGARSLARAKLLQHTAQGRRLLEQGGVSFDPGQWSLGSTVTTKLGRARERFTGEASNQELAFLAMYEHGVSKGLPPQQAINYAKMRGQLMTQFTPLLADMPPAFRGPFAGVFFQFKRFPIKQIELLTRMAQTRNVPGIARWLGAVAAMGGAAYFMRQFLLPHGKRKEIHDELVDHLGKTGADIAMYGLPSLLGIDISGSMALGEEPFGASLYEKIGRQAVGPAISIGYETGKAALTPRREPLTTAQEVESAIRRFPTLRPAAELIALVRGDLDLRSPDGEARYRRTVADAIRGLGSFRSVRESDVSLYTNWIVEVQKEIQDLKNAVYVAATGEKGDPDAAYEAIAKFNERWPEFQITDAELNEYLKRRGKDTGKTDVERLAGKRFESIIPEIEQEP